jgi:hypothetical protein
MFARFVREEVAVLQFGLRGYSVKRSSHRHVGFDLTAGCNTTLHTWQFRNVHPPNVGVFLPITTLPEILVVFKCEAATLVYAAHWQFFCRAAGLPMNTDTPAAPYSLAIFIGRNHLLASEVCL